MKQKEPFFSDKTCKITGLKLVTYPEWEDLHLSKNLHCGFALLGDHILFSRLSGTPDSDSVQLYIKHRKEFLETNLLWNKPILELQDYRDFRPGTKRNIRTVFETEMQKESSRGYLKGFAGFGLPSWMRWISPMKGSIKKLQYPVILTSGCEDAVKNLLKIDRGEYRKKGFRLSRGNLDTTLTERPEWNLDMEGFQTFFRVYGDRIIYYKPVGTSSLNELRELFRRLERIYKEMNMDRVGYHYQITDLRELQNVNSTLRKEMVKLTRELNEKHPLKIRIIVGIQPMIRAMVGVVSKIVPVPIIMEENLEGALDRIRLMEKQKQPSAKPLQGPQQTESTGTGSVVSSEDLNELLQYLSDVDWKNKRFDGDSPRPALPQGHPLENVYDSVALLKREFDNILSKKNEAENQIIIQNRLNKLRVDIWKLATNRSLDEKEFVQTVLNQVGPVFDVDRLTYHRLTGGNRDKRELRCVGEWTAPGVESILGEIVPSSVVRHFFKDRPSFLSKDSLEEKIPPLLRPLILPMVQKLIDKRNLQYVTILPFTLNGRLEGWFTFVIVKGSKRKPLKDPAMQKLGEEIVQQVSSYISQKLLEKTLKQSPRVLNDIINNSSNVIYVKDLEGRYSFVNNQWIEIFGINEEGAVNRTSDEILPEEYTSQSSDQIVAQEGISMKEEESVVINGQKRNFLSSKFPVFDLDGNPRAMVNISTDITEQKENEAAMQSRDRFLEAVARSVSVLIMEKDLDRAINQALEILGMESESDSVAIFRFDGSVYKRAWNWSRPGVPPTCHMDNLEPQGDLSRWFWEFEHRRVIYNLSEDFPDAEQMILNGCKIRSFIGAPVFVREKLIGFVYFETHTYVRLWPHSEQNIIQAFADTLGKAITNRQDEQALEEAKDEAEKAAKVKGEFLANMSHEIRTPMNAIIGLNHLLTKTGLNSKQQDYVQKTGTAAKSLLGIINDILDFSKIDAGKLEIESVEFDLNEVFENLSSLISMKAQEKGLELVFAPRRDVPVLLKGDPLRLGQMLLNLASNAVKFTEEGEVVISVDVESRREERLKLRFNVKDTGIGLSSEQVVRLFSAFSQADTSTTRKYGGTGLGLAITKRLAELMGGFIEVHSKEGEGSTFSFVIELQEQKEQTRKKRILPSKIRDLRVLVVDDNDSSREVLLDYLKEFTFRGEAVESGEKAVERVLNAQQHNEQFDLILMDWKMPGMNGMETSKKIKQSSLELIPQVIMVTSYGREELMRQAERNHLSGFLIKPVTPSLLFDAILQVFGEVSEEDEEVHSDQDLAAELDPVRGNRILLVEDNLINQQVARELLETEDFLVDIAENGEVACAMVEENPGYAGVLMDLQMPVMDGYEATREMRDSGLTLPIIAMTADAMAGVAERAMETGMDDYVSKPIDPMELFKALITHLPHRTGEKQKNRKTREHKDDSPMEIPSMEGIDIKEGLHRVAGNHSLYRKLLISFQDTLSTVEEKMNPLLEDKNYEDAERVMHSLKGVAGNIGARELYPSVMQLDDLLKTLKNGSIAPGKEGDLQLLWKQVLQCIAELQETLDSAALDNNAPDSTGAPKGMQAGMLRKKVEDCAGKMEEYDTESTRIFQEIRSDLQALLPEDGSDSDGLESLDRIDRALGAYDFEEAHKEMLYWIKRLKGVMGE